MGKVKLFLDFDNTIVNSSKAFCEVYNEVFFEDENFVEADWTKIEKYNMSCQCPLVQDEQDGVHLIFDSRMFFDKLEFMHEAYEVIKYLNTKFDIYICTIGTPINISRKSRWIAENLPFIHNLIFLSNDGVIMDKSIVDMDAGIFIDDNGDSLKSSNASVKIRFGKEHVWNDDVDGYVIKSKNWNDIFRDLNQLDQMQEYFIKKYGGSI